MHSIAQVQFPPLEKLEILASRGSCADLEVFEFLAQLSPSWARLYEMAKAWNYLIEKSRNRNFIRLIEDKSDSLFDARDLNMAEDENRARFFELSCIWVGRNFKDYFEELLLASETISRLKIAEPETNVFSIRRRLPSKLFDPPFHTYEILLRSWPTQRVLIAQAEHSFLESKELDYESIDGEFDDLESRMGLVKNAVLQTQKEFGGYVGYWRRPQAGFHSKYSEHWSQFLGTASNRRTNRFTGHVVIDLLLRLAHEQSQGVVREFGNFLSHTFSKRDLRSLYDWACLEDGRIVLTKPTLGKLTRKFRPRC